MGLVRAVGFPAPFVLTNGRSLSIGSRRGLISTSKSLNAFVGDTPASLNMLAWSEQRQATDFTIADDFSFTGASVDGSSAGPNGEVIATHIVESAGSGNHFVFNFNHAQCQSLAPLPFRFACIAKASERSRIVLAWEVYLHETATSASVGFDLAGGNVGYDTAHGTDSSISNPTMTALGGGWYLCYFDATYTGTAFDSSVVIQPKVYIDNGTGTGTRSINYVGNGTSGVNILWTNLLPAHAWNINRTVFFDDFLTTDTIDLGNTLNPGYNWYINNNAPNSANQAWWGADVLPASYPAAFTISSPSVLKMCDPRANAPQWSTMMYSVGFPVAGGCVGQAWQAPVIMEGSFSWDSTLTGAAYGASPAFWGHQVEAMAGTMDPSSHWSEWDIIDVGGQRCGPIDEWLVAGTPNTQPFTATINKAFSTSRFKKVSGLWLDTVTTGGWGLYMSFVDGQMCNFGDIAYSSTSTLPVSVAGALYAGDTFHQPIMVNTGSSATATPGGYPLYVDWIRVRTP